MPTGFLCQDKGLPTAIFFPKVEKRETVSLAKSFCKLCLRRKDCLQTALKTNEEHGIFGGLTYRERKRYVVRVALMASRDYSLQNKTSHEQRHPVYVDLSSLEHILDVQIRIQLVLSQVVEESQSYQVALPKFL